MNLIYKIPVSDNLSREISKNSSSRVSEAVSSGKITKDEIDYVSTKPLLFTGEPIDCGPVEFNLLRKLASKYDSQLTSVSITSHRPVIGKVVVGIKKIFFPIVKVFLSGFIEKQREFNALTVQLLAELIKKNNKS